MSKTVFTNGCFDILHPGHIDLLARAKALGSRLVVGINSDGSVRAIKGPDRPIMSQEDRKKILEALGTVDEVVIFDELTPEKLIHNIKPDVLVKGGDWSENEIIGADFVKRNGGEVYSLPLLDGYSSSKIFAKALGTGVKRRDGISEGWDGAVREHIAVMTDLMEHRSDDISKASNLLISTFVSGSKVLICGNGGSAADAQHLAAEFVGRYELERRSLPAIALTTDTSALTAISNDYGYDNVFERQVTGLANKGDCLIAISTSGNSANVISAVMAARSLGCSVIGMTGQNGKKLASLCDVSILVPSGRTARIQEAHITIAHIWCEVIDKIFTTENQTN
jgi:D-sedoheptulose 7-phosphate isomerase